MEELDDRTVATLRRLLVGWYRAGHRDLPWRRAHDAYAIWVSEIMLQQTRVDTVAPYFERWMARFPDASSLAAAPLDDVLAAWAGLGYYARARNLHAAARELCARYDGRFPDDPAAVRALPGIGPYTAGAILSIAFGRPEPILDGNVARVLARVFRVAAGATNTGAQRRLWELAARLVPPKAASDFNQSLMELGALVCTPRSPLCASCPIATACQAHRTGEVAFYPTPKERRPPRRVQRIALLVERRGRLLFLRRPPSGLWGGLWEPPSGDRKPGEPALAAAVRVGREVTGLELSAPEHVADLEHTLTHRKMYFEVFRTRAADGARVRPMGYDAARWIAPGAAAEIGVAAWTSRMLATPPTGIQNRRSSVP